MSVANIWSIFRDPPPEFAFEIAADGIAVARTRQPAATQHVPLAPGVIAPSPLKENILDTATFADAMRKLLPPGNRHGRRTAALILPDNSVRISVLEFDSLPDKEEDRRSLIRFRLRKSVPFDVDEAALSYFPQGPGNVVAAIAPAEIVSHYEAPFRAEGLEPGLVTVSSLAMIELLPLTGSILVARRSPGILTILAFKDGVLTLARSLELTPDNPDPLEEISADLYPTLAYIEDRSGARPRVLILAGFGSESAASARRLSTELEITAETLDEAYPGLAGYLASISHTKATAAAYKKAAAA